ncbi:MAG TPA: hypothetical protein VFS20_09805 [Longimicrobium sp.]|nr:hypothetical protein [Longimicrobium sp.]
MTTLSLGLMVVEPSLFTIWVLAVVFAGLGFWSARRWVWPGIVVLGQILISLWGAHDAITDPVNGPRLLAEAGPEYVTQSYVAHAISIAATVVGLVWGIARWRRRRDGAKQ